jgi:tRNA A-37 threonylcarbamoyl transferase component Bud32
MVYSKHSPKQVCETRSIQSVPWISVSDREAVEGDEIIYRSSSFNLTLEAWAKHDRQQGGGIFDAGSVIGGRYQVRMLLGTGGMGTVYRVYDSLDGVERALKVASLSYYKSSSGLLRFQQEFLAMSCLRHPNLPTVLDYGITQTGEPFLVMELVQGELNRTDQRVELSLFYEIFVQLLRALSFIHERGFLHRDVKPSNVLITRPSHGVNFHRVVLLDFGLMERIGVASQKSVAGTAAYIAPEVIKGKLLDPRTDLYSLGISAFEMLTGQLPFTHSDIRELFSMHERAARPRISSYRFDVPSQLDELIANMMAASPAYRPMSAEDVLLELAALTDRVQVSDLDACKSYLRLSDLVGRAAQMQQAREGLSAAVSGNGRCFLIAGLTGSGKTRLMQEIQIEALMNGFVVSGVAVREEHRTPYQALKTILCGLLPIATATNRLPTGTRVLERLFPEGLGVANMPATADAKPILPQDERGYLIEEFACWLQQVATERPVLILADDLQWCDESSLLVLRSLSYKFKGHRILLVGAFRSDEAAPGSDLDQWRYFEHVEVIETQAFTSEQTSQFLDGLLGRHTIGGDFISRVQNLTEGNPFFTIELLRELIDREILSRFAGIWKLMDRDFDVPESVSRLLDQRLRRIGDLARTVALQVAVAGGRLNMDDLSTLTESDQKVFLRALEELLQHRIATVSGDSVCLVHDSVRELIYRSADGEEVRRHHQCLAEMYEARRLSGSTEQDALLGHHFARGVDKTKGLMYLERAGRLAFEAEQHGAARDLLLEADSLLANLPQIENHEQRIYEVRKMLSLVCVSDDYARGVEYGEWVYHAAMKRGILRLLPFLQTFLPNPIPFFLILAVALPVRLLFRGRSAVRELQRDLIDMFTISPYQCNCLASTSKFNMANHRADRLRAFSLTRNSLAFAVIQIGQLTSKYWQLGPDLADDLDCAEKILTTNRQAQTLDDYTRTMATGVCYYAIATAEALEQNPKFNITYRRAEQYATEHGNYFLHHLNALALMEHSLFAGDVFTADKAEGMFQTSLQKFGGKSRAREWVAERIMGQVDIDCGRFDRAVRRKTRLIHDGPGFFTEGFGSLLEARLNLEWGKHEAALESIRRALRWFRDPDVEARFVEFLAFGVLSEIHIAMGKGAYALQVIEEMMPFAFGRPRPTEYFQIEVLRRQAVALCFEQPDDALSVACRSLEMTSRGHCPKQLADCHLAVAFVLKESGAESAKYVMHTSCAQEIYSQLGNRHRAKKIGLGEIKVF